MTAWRSRATVGMGYGGAAEESNPLPTPTRAVPILESRLIDQPDTPRSGLNGGRTWWAHFEFTRINIEPTILRKKTEDVHEAGANVATRRQLGPGEQCSRS